MSQSSPTVFVIVHGDFLPIITGTLQDIDGEVVPRPGKDVILQLSTLEGVLLTPIVCSWADSPTNTRPTHEWEEATILDVDVYYGRFITDPDGPERWSFPTEDKFTVVVRAQ